MSTGAVAVCAKVLVAVMESAASAINKVFFIVVVFCGDGSEAVPPILQSLLVRCYQLI